MYWQGLNVQVGVNIVCGWRNGQLKTFLLELLRSYQDKLLSTLHELLSLSNKEKGETAPEHLSLNEHFFHFPLNHIYVLNKITSKYFI